MRTAKIRKVAVLFVVLALDALSFSWSSVFAQAGSDQESAKSVVKITSRLPNGKVEIGTGFVWSQPDYVVTALHVVAGAASISVYSETLKKERGASVINVHQESDLALLKLESNDLGLTPLKVAPPNINEKHYIWGYPKDVNTMQGDGIYFSRSQQQQSTMGSIFKSEAEFLKSVGEQGYPKFAAKILRVGDIIVPGHSGAPILNASGAVVGVGDGGLYQGIARINWAIPAQTYLAGLPASKDLKPSAPSKQANLYSASSSAPVEIKMEASNTGAANAPQHALKLAWSATLADIYATSDHIDENDLAELDSLGLAEAVIDVYEDYESGATIAVPQGTRLSFNAQTRMVEAQSAEGRVRMFVQITKAGGTVAQGKFDRYVMGLRQWQPDPEEQDQTFREENFTEVIKWRVTFSSDEEDADVQSMLVVTLILDENDFLGTAVMADKVAELSEEDEHLLDLMSRCVELADFAIE